MKKILLTTFGISFCFALVNAQNRPASLNSIKERLKATNTHAPVPYQPAVSGNEMPVNGINRTVVSQNSLPANTSGKSSMVQVVVGNSTYDLQSNGSIQNRLYMKNGNVGAAWTFSTDLAGTYPDRGTGYNFYDGSAWGNLPTARIESDRRGWPSLLQLENGGERVVTHGAVTISTKISDRPVAGTGAWTENLNPNFPTGQNTLWVRTAAGGPDGNTLHMIDVSYPVGNMGTTIDGIDGLLNYSRSLDGGTTWDIVRATPSGVDSTQYKGFRADAYAIDAKDSIVAFVSGNLTDDLALWKSTDNGATFTRTVILDFPFTKYDDTSMITDVDGDGVADTLLTTDGSYAILIDNNGMVHVFAGAMLVLDDDPAALIGLFLTTDGLLYWNESMGTNPMVVIATAPDLDGSGAADNFAANLGGRYGNDGICSMPNAGIDAAGNIFVSYCPLIEGTDSGNPDPLAFSYRNVYLKASPDGGLTWNTPVNISNSQFDEAVFCAMAKNVDQCVSLLWQQDGAPGYSVPPNGEHSIGNNDFIYDCIDKTILLTGLNNPTTQDLAVSVYPNPASNNVVISFNAEKRADIKIEIRNVVGQIIQTINKTVDTKGKSSVNVNIEKYSSGVYTVNTIMGDKVFSTKFVKK